MRKFYLLILAVFQLVFFNPVLNGQNHFIPQGNPTSAMNFFLIEAKINGNNISAGYEVGIFDGSICVGTVLLTKSLGDYNDVLFASAVAYEDDADTKGIVDGFTTGHSISYKIWDAMEEVEIDVDSVFFTDGSLVMLSAAPTFESGGTAFVALNATFNYLPKARAGADVILNENSSGTLDGTASYDKDGSAITYLWEDVDGLGLSATNVAKPTFTAPMVTADTDFRLVLTVNDGEQNSNPDTVIVTVLQVDLPPVAAAGDDFEVTEGEAGALDGSVSSDPDGLTISYSWVIEPAEITLSDANVAQPSFTAPQVTNDKEYLAILTVTNTVSLSDIDTVIIKVININQTPIADAGKNQDVNEGGNVTLDGSFSNDPDTAPNPVLTYLWTSVEGIALNNATTVSPDFDAPFFLKDSVLQFILVVNDGGRDSEPDTVAVNVKHKNLLPTAVAGADFDVNENETGQLDGSASTDLDGTLTYLWTAPVGITITGDETANPTFTAPEVQADSVISFILLVTDDKLETVKDTVDVTVKHVNKMPVADAGAYQEVDENVTVTLDGSNSFDPDMNDVITYSWFPPVGISLDNSTAADPTFTSPDITASGEDFIDYEFVLVVNDGTVDSDRDTVVVRVIHLNIPPIAVAGNDTIVDENTVGTLNGTKSSDPEGKTLTYTWNAPAGFTVDSPTEAVSAYTAPEVQQDTTFILSLTVFDGIRSSIPDTIEITVNHMNKKPVADAGPDQTVDEGVLVTLDGTASADADAYDVITYMWSSNATMLNSNTTATPDFTSPMLMKDTVWTFILKVNDGITDSEPDTVAVTIKHANLQPTADAGADFALDENEEGQLIGSGSSDPEGVALTYLWSAPTGFIINNPAAVSPTFTAPNVEQTTEFEIVLTIDDGETERNTDTDTIIVTVYQVNKPAVANAGADFSSREQKTVTLDGTASYDLDLYDTVLYHWTAPVGVILDDPTSMTPSFTAGAVTSNTELLFVLEVIDLPVMRKSAQIPASNLDTVIVTITPNEAPMAMATNQTVNAEQIVTLHGEGSIDPDGDDLAYSWTAPVGITLTNPTSANPTFIAPVAEDIEVYSFTLIVEDDLGLKDTTTSEITVISNLPPVIKTEMVVYCTEGETVTLDASETTDPNGDGMTFKWMHYYATFVNKVVLNNKLTSKVTFVAPAVDELTYMPIILQVSDGMETSEETVKVYVKDKVNVAPMANAGEDFIVNENETSALDGTASTDVEGKPISYLWSSDYLSLSSTTAANPSFDAPEVSADTTVMITLVVNDGKSDSKTDTVLVTIKQVNVIPVADAGADIVVIEGEEITFDGSASSDFDGDSLTYTWSVVGLSITDADLVMSTVTAPEVEEDMMIPVVLVVNDGELNSAPDTVWVNILQVNKTLEIDTVEDASADMGYAYSVTVMASDPDLMDEITFSSDDLPTWLTLTDNGDGTATISTDSIPRVESLLGEHTITIKATDGSVIVETSFVLTVTIKTGIEDLFMSKVKFYPNPTHGIVNVEFNRLPDLGTSIEVYNQLGQSVMLRQANSSNTQLNLLNNPVGLYYIKVTSKNASRTEKVILR